MLVALLVLEIPVAGLLTDYLPPARPPDRYVLLGVIPGSRVGLRTASEMYAFGFVYGFSLGAFTVTLSSIKTLLESKI
eukprot:tig00021441_g21555.t1